MKADRCDLCSSGRLLPRRVRHLYRAGRRALVVMDNVPAYVCNQCGHRYFDGEVVEEMDRVSRRRSQLKRKVTLPQFTFRAVKTAR